MAHNITIRRNSLSESTKVMDDTEDEYTSLLHDNEVCEVQTVESTTGYSIPKKELITYIICFFVAFIFWNIPADESKGITQTSMHLSAVFLLMVMLLLFTSARISIVIAFSLGFLSLTQNFKCRTVDGIMVDCSKCGKPINDDEIYQCNASKGAFSIALSGFSHHVNWLVFFAYQIGKCIEITGLGKRISYIILKTFGSSLKGIGYAIFIIELVLAPFIPCNVARGGCIVLPIVNSIIENITQNYHNVPSKALNFLYLCGSHANLIISSIYLTASASNPVLVSKVVSIYGHEYELHFVKWFIGAIVPGAIVILIVPQVISMYLKQGNIDLEHTQTYSERMLRQMKSITTNEKYLCVVFAGCLTLWITGTLTGLDAALVTFLGVLSLIALRVITWDDIIGNKKGMYFILIFGFLI